MSTGSQTTNTVVFSGYVESPSLQVSLCYRNATDTAWSGTRLKNFDMNEYDRKYPVAMNPGETKEGADT